MRGLGKGGGLLLGRALPSSVNTISSVFVSLYLGVELGESGRGGGTGLFITGQNPAFLCGYYPQGFYL